MFINDLSYCEDINSVEEKIVGGIDELDDLGQYGYFNNFPPVTGVIITGLVAPTIENPLPCDQYVGTPQPWELHLYKPCELTLG